MELIDRIKRLFAAEATQLHSSIDKVTGDLISDEGVAELLEIIASSTTEPGTMAGALTLLAPSDQEIDSLDAMKDDILQITTFLGNPAQWFKEKVAEWGTSMLQSIEATKQRAAGIVQSFDMKLQELTDRLTQRAINMAKEEAGSFIDVQKQKIYDATIGKAKTTITNLIPSWLKGGN